MSFIHSSSTRVLLNAYSWSARVRKILPQHHRDYAKVTALADTGAKYLPGLMSGSLSIEGMFEAGTGANNEVITNTSVQNGLLVSVAPAGFTLGNYAFTAHGNVANYDVNADVKDVVGFTVNCDPDDGVDWGVSLHDLVAETTSASGSSVDDNGASSANGAVGSLHVTAANGTSVVVKIQHSTDNVSFSDLITFTTATGLTSERKTVTGTVNRYVRASWTVTGTSFTFAVVFARR